MTKIRPIYDEKILPDGSKTPFYPLTSAKAVYTDTNHNIQHLLNEGYRFGGIVMEPIQKEHIITLVDLLLKKEKLYSLCMMVQTGLWLPSVALIFLEKS